MDESSELLTNLTKRKEAGRGEKEAGEELSNVPYN